MFAVKSSHSATALMTVSVLSLAINVAVLVYAIHRIRTYKLNPLKDELYRDTKAYQQVASANGPALGLVEETPATT